MTQTAETKRGPGRPRSLTVATEKTIARRYATGKWTLAALAEHYSIAVGTVRAIVKRNPVESAAPVGVDDRDNIGPQGEPGVFAGSEECGSYGNPADGS